MGFSDAVNLLFKISANGSDAQKEIRETAALAVSEQKKVAAEASKVASQSLAEAVAAKSRGAANAEQLATDARNLISHAQNLSQGVKVAENEAAKLARTISGVASPQSSAAISSFLGSITGLGSSSKIAGALVTDFSGSIGAVGSNLLALANPATIAVAGVAAVGAAAVFAGI